MSADRCAAVSKVSRVLQNFVRPWTSAFSRTVKTLQSIGRWAKMVLRTKEANADWAFHAVRAGLDLATLVKELRSRVAETLKGEKMSALMERLILGLEAGQGLYKLDQAQRQE